MRLGWRFGVAPTFLARRFGNGTWLSSSGGAIQVQYPSRAWTWNLALWLFAIRLGNLCQDRRQEYRWATSLALRHLRRPQSQAQRPVQQWDHPWYERYRFRSQPRSKPFQAQWRH